MADRLRPPGYRKFSLQRFLQPISDRLHVLPPIERFKQFAYGTPRFAILANDPAMPVAQEVGHILGKTVPQNQGTFGNAEYRVIVPQSEVQTRDVYVFQTTNGNPDSNLRQAKLLALGAKGAGATRIYSVCSHLAYARQDRILIPGEPDSARNVIQENLDAGSHNYRKRKHDSHLRANASLMVVDVHSEKPLTIVNRDSHYEWANLNSDYILLPVIAALMKEKDLDPVFAFPDVTAAKKYGSSVALLGIDPATSVTVKKVRPSGQKNHVELASDQEDFAAKVAGKDVIVRDDIFDTGGTAIQSCKAFIEAGARSVRVVVTHGVLSRDPNNPEKDALHNIDSPYLTELIITDTIPPTEETSNHPKITIISHAPLLAETIRRIENKQPLGDVAKSMSPGFEHSYLRLTKINTYRREAAREKLSSPM